VIVFGSVWLAGVAAAAVVVALLLPPPQAASRPGTVRIELPAAARRRKAEREMRSVI